jgi:hypothetical protein
LIAFINSSVLKYTVFLRVGFCGVDVDGGVTRDQDFQDLFDDSLDSALYRAILPSGKE